VTIVQDPAEAFSADMPRNAMRYLEVDHVVPASALGATLNRLTREPVDGDGGEPAAPSMIQETRIARLEPEEIEGDEKPGIPSEFACPECHGGLREIQEGNLLRFRCRTGHAYSPETLLQTQDEDVERALFLSLRAIEERLALRRRLLDQARARRLDSLSREWETRTAELEKASRALSGLLRKKRTVPASSPAR
jgi:two-component system, chemotaxis family, protein-glutamate methylesterase/glutaminase